MSSTCRMLVILITITSCANTVNRPKDTINSFNQMAGTYEVIFSRLKNGQTIAQTEGLLTLVPTTENDISPKTGAKPPPDEDRNKIPFYGWIDADFDKVKAPVFLNEKVEPSPNSKDPIYPGVLFHILGQPLGGKTGAVLTVSRNGNFP